VSTPRLGKAAPLAPNDPARSATLILRLSVFVRVFGHLDPPGLWAVFYRWLLEEDMSDPLKKVQSGQPLVIPANAYNTFIDAARDYQDRRMRQQARTVTPDTKPGVVLVRNTSGADQNRFAVMEITSPVIGPTDNLLEFQNKIAFDAVAPTADGISRFVVLAEPIKNTKLGQAVLAGITPVQIDVTDESAEYAQPIEAETGYLRTASTGSARIVWKDVGTGLKWGVVQIPAGGAGCSVKVGIITACDYAAGTATVELATGTLGSLTGTGETIEAYQGPGGWHIVGDEVILFQAPDGVTPAWIIDNPSAVSDCG